MTLQQLKYVSMVERCGSFSKAAQKLYVSQPSVSNLVHGLEEELHITIFQRTPSGVVITNEGRELLKLGNKLLRDADYIDEYFHAGGEGRRPSLLVSSQHYDFVVAAFEDFVAQAEDDRYTQGLNQNQTSVVIDDVRRQYSDLGVLFMSDVNRRHMEKTLEDNDLAFHPLLRSRPHAFMSHSHPLAQRTSVTPEELMDYPCIVYEQSADSPAFYSEEMLLPNFYPPRVVYISDLYVSTALRPIEEAFLRHLTHQMEMAKASGMGAVSGALFAELQCGDHAIFTRAKYSGTEDVTSDWLPRFGIQHDVFDAADLSQLEPLIKPNTKVIYVESPANPTMVLVDIAAVAEIAHRYGVKVFVDNTFATPYNTRPLELGADVVIHSLTKYMGGHGDILGGAVVSNDTEFLRRCRLGTLMHFGAVIAPFTAFLVCRGLKTLGVRMRQYNESALKVARWLEAAPRVEIVRYPMLESNPQYDIARRQMKGGSGMLSFDVKGWLEAAGITDGMIRMSVGLEDPDDIIADLDQALAHV